MFAFQDTRGPVDVAFTDRHGGSSGGPFASLNLAERGGDSAEVVRRNLRAVTEAFTGGMPGRTVLMRQVHGGEVHVVAGPAESPAGSPTGSTDGSTDGSADWADPPEADALVTALPDVVLVVRVADCVPVVLADPVAGVVGVAHAGRPGLVAEVVPHTVRVMRSLGATDVTAWLGPHVCGACYEVPAPMRAEVAARVPASFAETSWGTPSLDIGAGVRAQLREAGVPVVDASRCTVEDEDLYSYRRQGERSGRLAGLVRRRP